ncbi:Uncharacterised protein [Actinomadura madurae]|nr:Uncharacterised protein [Actinomadura madurae]
MIPSPAFVNLGRVPAFTPVQLRNDLGIGLDEARRSGVAVLRHGAGPYCVRVRANSLSNRTVYLDASRPMPRR